MHRPDKKWVSLIPLGRTLSSPSFTSEGDHNAIAEGGVSVVRVGDDLNYFRDRLVSRREIRTHVKYYLWGLGRQEQRRGRREWGQRTA